MFNFTFFFFFFSNHNMIQKMKCRTLVINRASGNTFDTKHSSAETVMSRAKP